MSGSFFVHSLQGILQIYVLNPIVLTILRMYSYSYVVNTTR